MRIDKTAGTTVTVHSTDGSFIGSKYDHAESIKDLKSIAGEIVGSRSGKFTCSAYQDGGYFHTFNLKA